jgi:hypothetical protein
MLRSLISLIVLVVYGFVGIVLCIILAGLLYALFKNPLAFFGVLTK